MDIRCVRDVKCIRDFFARRYNTRVSLPNIQRRQAILEGEEEEQKETETTSPAVGEEEPGKELEKELSEAEDECPELGDLSAANKDFKPFRDSDSLLQMAEHMRRRRTDSEGTMGSMGSCSTIPLEVVRQKVRRQLSKQQKAAQRRRLQKGEANLVTSVRRENDSNIKCSMESDSFWG
ncbi:hypothetical protein KUCAC02_028119 [Chaenocephalus aceratus]|uniref:Uncharacterized protein n=1 Tax=Chaenocephalus aceratus TaxID=36190 RepID=A0ACB9X220_CHAAC|nr:hypothetical protein KUCAC02_028119 [Chaenocephalus aceratus]